MAPLPVFHRPLSMDSRDTSLTNSSSNSRPKGDTSAESNSGGCVGGGSTVSTIAASAASGAAAMNTSASIPNVSVGADTQSTTTNPELASSNDYLVPSTKASTPPRRYVHICTFKDLELRSKTALQTLTYLANRNKVAEIISPFFWQVETAPR